MILFFLLFFLSAFAQDWTLAKEKNGIKVYTREGKDSPIKEFKAVTIFEANMYVIEKILLNTKTYPEWYDHCKRAEQIGLQGNTVTMHMEYSMPFPFKNRDAVINLSATHINDLITIQITRNAVAIKEVEDIVRMPISEGGWQLRKINEHTTEVIHQFKGDPGGNIPVAIVNLFLVDGPLNTLTQLKGIVYQD
ncbi:hypothetical protein PA14_44080 [Sporocytophaga myxococcoides]|uniref:START domain-containing protein n=2 Tax=Sporocytophaga myxococcoides TaxID=153721 RepID=A0A098LHU8_9BACT|nr:hypothetical protein PA14_44080 [Sporocytophaga myxococcoides]